MVLLDTLPWPIYTTKHFLIWLFLLSRDLISSFSELMGPDTEKMDTQTHKNAGSSSERSRTVLPIIRFKFILEVEGVDEAVRVVTILLPCSLSLLPSPLHSIHLSNHSSSCECLLRLLFISSHSNVSFSRMWHLVDTFIPRSVQYHGCVHVLHGRKGTEHDSPCKHPPNSRTTS